MNIKVPKTNNPANRIRRGPVDHGRHIVLGTDWTTRQARKTRKGAAEWLYKCDEQYARTGKHIFNVDQRTALVERANGGSAKLYRPKDPMERFEDESLQDYVTRLQRVIEAKKAEAVA